jgi:hypothetical protein
MQIKASCQAAAYLAQMCRETGVEPRSALLFIRTRWGSLARCLDRVLYLKKVTIYFFSLHLLLIVFTASHALCA